MSEDRKTSDAIHSSNNINPRILLLALGMFALGTDAFVIAGVLPVIAQEVHVSEGLAGQLVTVFSFTYGLGAPLLAALTGRLPRNQVLVTAIGAFALVNLGSALAPNFFLLLLTRFLAGCCAALYAPLAYTIGTSLAPQAKRGQALAFVVLGLTVATVFGSPLGTWIGQHAGWRFSFGLVAALAGFAFIMLLLCGLPRGAEAPALSLQARLAPIREPHLLLALAPALLWNLGIYVVYTYLAPILHQGLHITDISIFLLIFGIGVVIGNWYGGVIADRFGTVVPLYISLLILALVLVLISLLNTLFIGMLGVLFAMGITGSLIFIPQQYRLLRLAPEHANVILALNNSTLYLGIAGGAALGGVIIQWVPLTTLGWTGAAFVLLALGTLITGTRLTSKRHTTGSSDQKEMIPTEV